MQNTQNLKVLKYLLATTENEPSKIYFLYFITRRVLIIFMYESMNNLKSDPELQPCETSENAERGRFIPQADRNPAAAHQGPGCPA